MKELAGRVALVTGAGRNIGRAIALDLAAAGASVVVNARSSRAEIDAVAAETGGLAVLADVTDAAAVERMVAQALERYGRIDILVNNAAVRAVEPLERISYERWREVTGIILDGAWICARACLPCMAGGSIVNIGGMSARATSPARPCT